MINFTTLISGSSGNASCLTDGKTHLLIDCGMSGKQLAEALSRLNILPNQIDALLITHEHIDHTKGAGVVARRYGVPVYATSGTHKAMDIGKIEESQIKVINTSDDFEIGTIGIKAFDIPHDAANPAPIRNISVPLKAANFKQCRAFIKRKCSKNGFGACKIRHGTYYARTFEQGKQPPRNCYDGNV